MTGPYVAGPFRVEPTGKQAQVTAMEWFHIEDGKIVRRWATRDRLGFLQQVGAPIKIG
ncbi:MAG: ester cyclase [Dehalococcoidia bacterium]|nr:ester cyclase [Dehalococcoidia bacterium]